MSKRSIVYFTGKAIEEWTPESLETGIWGSETAVIYLAREWVKSGHKVTVYSSCGIREGDYDGVEYLNYQRFEPSDFVDTLILWRDPAMIDLPFHANRIWLDLHDIPNPEDYTLDRLKKVHKIFVKSDYQRSLLPHVPEDKFFTIPNAINPQLLEWKIQERSPYKLIYASGYGRGLEEMLTYG